MRAFSVVVGLVVTLTVLGGVSAGVYAPPASSPTAASGSTADRITTIQAANTSDGPGERLAGAIGVHAAELTGEVDQRAFGLRIARSSTNHTKANVVRGEIETLDGRLAELEQRQAALEAARANNTITEGRYRAEVAILTARAQTLQAHADATEAQLHRLPADVQTDRGLDSHRVRIIRRAAQNLTGPAAAEIAREIAGGGIGHPIHPRPSDRGPGETPPSPYTSNESGGSGPPDAHGSGNETSGNEPGGPQSDPANESGRDAPGDSRY